jgi:hypothetical protein
VAGQRLDVADVPGSAGSCRPRWIRDADLGEGVQRCLVGGGQAVQAFSVVAMLAWPFFPDMQVAPLAKLESTRHARAAGREF